MYSMHPSFTHPELDAQPMTAIDMHLPKWTDGIASKSLIAVPGAARS